MKSRSSSFSRSDGAAFHKPILMVKIGPGARHFMKSRNRSAVSAVLGGLFCACALIALSNLLKTTRQSVMISASDSDDPSAFEPNDLRDGNPLPPGARASPEEVEAIYNSLDKKVSEIGRASCRERVCQYV